MDVADLIGLLSYTFGAFCFGGLVLLSLLRRGRPGWGGGSQPAEGRARAEAVGLLLMALSFVWFLVQAALTLALQRPEARPWTLQTIVYVLAFLFPPLVMHVTYAETQCSENRLTHPLWRAVLWLTYALSFVIGTLGLLGFYRVIDYPFAVGPAAGTAIGLLFAATGIYSCLALARAPSTAESGPARSSRRAMIVLFTLLIGVCGLILATNLRWIDTGAFLRLVTTNLPLAFIFVGVFFDDRFQFFDLFVKRGVALAATVLLFGAWFAVSLPALERLELGWARAWVHAIVLLPVASALPWAHRRLARWLDSVWLGRRYTALEGLKAFLANLQQATSEPQLVERAEAGLSEIFRAPARVTLDPRESSAPFEVVEAAPIRLGGEAVGSLQLGPRSNQVPYFSEDTALVSSLADVFASMLANVRLQRKEREQDERARELSLHASRSELKALRAQVNPHFLFNALNAIAGLIHQDPLRADRTVEQLAEVFRYTLRRSEHEWARLEDELEFVRAYLEIEQARFGDRLRSVVRSEPGIAGARIPAMLVQTLVENAVKHGAAAVRGPALIEISARRERGALLIEVADSGPGFHDGENVAARPKGEGHGLANVRRRLAGHFGAEAELAIGRDAERGRTVVTIRMPEVAAPDVQLGPALASGDPAGAA